MKKHSKQEIENLRKIIVEEGGRKVDTEVAGRKFTYYIMPARLNEALPDFVCRTSGDFRDGYTIGISDEFPEEMQKYAVFHEYTEFLEIGIDAPGRCLKALERELAELPQEIRADYIARRARFFRNLVSYLQKDTENYTPEDIKEIEASRDRLNELERQLKGESQNDNK